MDTFKINIEKHNGTFYVSTARRKERLFTFFPSDYSNDTWFFDVPERQTGLIFTVSDTVPVKFINELIKSLIIIRYGVIEFEVDFTAQANKLLGIKQ